MHKRPELAHLKKVKFEPEAHIWVLLWPSRVEELLTGVRAPVKEINIFTVLKFFTV